jgi:GAF domain-containing protein
MTRHGHLGTLEGPPPSPEGTLVNRDAARGADPSEASEVLDRLIRITSALADAETPTAVANVIVETLRSEFDVPSGGVWLKEGDVLQALAATWDSPHDLARFAKVAVDDDLPAAEVLRTGEAVWVATVEEAAARFPALAVGRGFFVLPLQGASRRFGVLAGSITERQRLSAVERQFLLATASLGAQALERTMLVSSERRTRLTLEFLGEATRVMVKALDPDAVLRTLVRLAVPRLAPWCAVYLAGDGVLTRVALEIAGDRTLRDLLGQSNPVTLDSASPLARTWRTGQTQVLDHVTAETVARSYPPDLARRIVGDERTWSALIAPVVVANETIGVMSLVSDRWGGAPSRAVQFAAEGLATRAGMALDAARRYRGQRDLVDMFTNALLPARLPTIDGLDLAARYISPEGGVCGDWYDVDEVAPGEVLFALGDAVGHGLAASTTMAKLRNAARGLAVVDRRPSAILRGLSVLVESDQSIATALYGLIDPRQGRARWSSAGHIPPFVLCADGSVAVADGPPVWPVLGVPFARGYQDRTTTLEPNDSLVLVSDGVVERRSLGIDTGLNRLRHTLERCAGESVGALAERIAAEHCRQPEDDCCILVIKRLSCEP